MSFIRAKEIPRGSGNFYDYQVKSVNLGKGKIRQVHIRYIGKSGRTSSLSLSGGSADWNDVVRPENVPDVNYNVELNPRRSRIKARPVTDVTLTPIEDNDGG